MRLRTVFPAFLTALALVCGLAAQDKRPNEDGNTRSVQGVVTDASGNLWRALSFN